MQKPSEETMRRVFDNLRAFFTIHSVSWSATTGTVGKAAVVHSEDDLEYWGNFFVENRLHARGIVFETFMLHPFEISQAVLFKDRLHDPEDFLPLLPRQRDAARQVHPHVPAISKPLPPGRFDLPIFLRRQAD